MSGKKPFFASKSKNVYTYRPTNVGYQKGIYTINKDKVINYEYFKGDILTNNTFTIESDNGLYTWIIKTSGNFYTVRQKEGQEIGTLHNNLVFLTFDNDPSDVKLAGEIEKIGPFITFNFASGTYMTKTEITSAIIDSFIKKLSAFGWSEANITYSGSIKTFINLENDRLKPSKNRTNKLNTMYKWSPIGGNHKKRLTTHNRKRNRKHRRTHKK